MKYYPGGMAEFCQVWNTNVCELPASISFEEAALLDPLSVAVHAIQLSGLEMGDDVLILGTGPIGLCIGQAVRAFGANQVFCTDVEEYSLKLARELGISDVIHMRKESPLHVLRRHGLDKVRIIFDTVGTSDSQKLALGLLKESGTLVELAVSPIDLEYKLLDIAGERRIISSANNRTEDFLAGIQLIERGVVQAEKMISHIFSLQDIQKGFDLMMEKENASVMKIVICP